MNDKLDDATRRLEDGCQHMLFTFAPEKFWKMKYEDEYKSRSEDYDKHRNQLWQITAAAVVLIGFAFTLGLAL